MLTPESDWGKAWGIHLTSIDDRERDEHGYRQALLDVADGGKDAPTWASGEMVAPLIDSLVTGEHRELPVNLPNRGQAPYLPADVVVETMCIVDADGVHGRDEIVPPARVCRVDPPPCRGAGTARSKRRSRAIVMRCARRWPSIRCAVAPTSADIEAMTDDLLAATAAWLPQFQ